MGSSLRPAVVGTFAFAGAVAADLASKVYAVASAEGPRAVVYNDRQGNLAVRLWVCLVTVAVVYLLERLGRRRGLGRLWGAWAGIGVLIGGTLSNGVSTYLWERGVPDFIHMSGGWVWNVADFEIAFGLLGAAASSVAAAVLAYARARA